MERWSELRTAFHVAKLGTVSAASRALGTHRATVNRHIDALEEELGARIFIRNPKGYTLTELGEELLKVAQKTDQLFEDLVNRAKTQDGPIEGEIKITSLLPVTNVLMEPISAFRRANPDCQITIISTDELQRLEYGEAHIAVRAGAKPEHPDYVVQSFDQTGLNLYAHTSYLSRNGTPNTVADLAFHEFVMPALNERRLAIWSWIDEHIADPKVAVATNDPLVVREAVYAGLGLGVLSDIDVAGKHDLRAILPSHKEWAIPLWLVTHVDLHRTEKVQAMLKHLRAFRC
ncbi:LysR family transcriptional regulator [Flexibacterium corallicola]|uniref:LysR family transcriptional regulator n=1 Tax=Flexibacterium corallicola TaxID=3037259 RepID=UPI00286F7F9C|nr:LysR family transcriptional regulator [Pseudovibrio sp. M1P-2-3]